VHGWRKRKFIGATAALAAGLFKHLSRGRAMDFLAAAAETRWRRKPLTT